MNEGSPCKVCLKDKPADGYKLCSSCRGKNRDRMRKWRTGRPANLAYMRQWQRRRREAVIAHYGGRCACCGESEYGFLAIDHKNGGGTKHRENVGHGSHMVAWIIQNGFPDDFQILCHNCNQAIGYYGACPHAERVAELIAV